MRGEELVGCFLGFFVVGGGDVCVCVCGCCVVLFCFWQRTNFSFITITVLTIISFPWSARLTDDLLLKGACQCLFAVIKIFLLSNLNLLCSCKVSSFTASLGPFNVQSAVAAIPER